MENTIRSFFDRAVQENSGRLALEYLSGGERLGVTFGEMDVRVRQLAELLATLGISPRSRPVALMLENGPDWVEMYLALSGSAIPVVPMDPKLRPAEVVYILRDAGACAIVTDPAHIELVERVAPDLPSLQTVLLFAGDDTTPPEKIAERDCINIAERLPVLKYAAASPEGRYATVEPAPEDVAAIIYTSGSTGTPKGAMITHGNFAADAEGTLASIKVLRSSDRFLVVLPLFHAFSFTANMLLALNLQARLQFVGSLRTLDADLKRYKPTVMMAVPLLLEKMAAKIDNALRTNRWMLLFQAFHLRGLVKDIIRRQLGGSLKLLITGGAPCPPGVINFMRRFGASVVEGYGLSEASPVVSVTEPKIARIGTIGKAIVNIEARIDNPNEQGIGELVIKGPIVMKGYLNLPEATAETLAGGWLHTGDLASMDADGYITIRGRKKSLIVNREGKNIYPEEVEQCIGRDKLLKDVLVLGYHDREDIGEKVGVIIVPDEQAFKASDGSQLPRPEIEARVRAIVQTQCGDLAAYKHPRKIDIRFEPLKRTAALKIERKAYQGQLDR